MISRGFLNHTIKTASLSSSSTSSASIDLPYNIVHSRSHFSSVYHTRRISLGRIPSQSFRMATSSKVHLSLSDCGVFHTPAITKESAAKASEVLQDNHDHHHIFFNSEGFHSMYSCRNRPDIPFIFIYLSIFCLRASVLYFLTGRCIHRSYCSSHPDSLRPGCKSGGNTAALRPKQVLPKTATAY